MRYPFFAIGLLLSSSFAQASVVVGGTRLVFDGTKNNAVITVENKDQNSNIVQSWLSVVDAASPAKDAFIITPPLFRLKAGEKGFVRVVRSGKKLPILKGSRQQNMYLIKMSYSLRLIRK